MLKKIDICDSAINFNWAQHSLEELYAIKMKLSKLPGLPSPEIRKVRPLEPDGQNDTSVAQLSHVSWNNK